MLRRPPLLAALLALLIAAPAAGAASLTADQACYVEHGPVTLSGAGFGAGDTMFVQGNQVFESGPADPAGGFQVTFQAPLTGTITPGHKRFTITATDQVTQVASSVDILVANATFGTTLGVALASKPRTWSFSGLFQHPGKPIYGHFRFKGRTYSDHRFGVPKAPCGELRAKAPLIPGAKPRAGTWTVQVDFAKRYKATTKPRLTSRLIVFRTLI